MKPINIIQRLNESYDMEDNKNGFNRMKGLSESSLKEENRYGNTEDDDPVLDKTIKVYDINDFVDKEINTEEGRNYKAFNYPNGAAIIVTSDGEGAILDYEAVGVSFNSTSDTIYLNLCEKDTDDGNGHMSVAIMPSARVKVTIDELLKSPSKEMKVRDFFEKYNYNDRCARNFDEIKHYLTECDKQLKEDSMDREKYYYITSANELEKYGDEYNSMANTELIDILDEVETYLKRASSFVLDVVSDSQRNYREYQFSEDDARYLSQAADKIVEAKDLIQKSWN